MTYGRTQGFRRLPGGLTGGYIIVSELEKEGVEYAEYTQKTVMAHIGRVIYRTGCLVFAREELIETLLKNGI